MAVSTADARAIVVTMSWTGAQGDALRRALRMPYEAFAATWASGCERLPTGESGPARSRSSGRRKSLMLRSNGRPRGLKHASRNWLPRLIASQATNQA